MVRDSRMFGSINALSNEIIICKIMKGNLSNAGYVFALHSSCGGYAGHHLCLRYQASRVSVAVGRGSCTGIGKH